MTSCSYLVLFLLWASSIWSSHSTVSSTMMMILVLQHVSGESQWSLRVHQELPVLGSLHDPCCTLMFPLLLSCIDKSNYSGGGARSAPAAPSATGCSTWLWHQVYQPCSIVFGQELNICSNVYLAKHSGQFGDSTFPWVKRVRVRATPAILWHSCLPSSPKSVRWRWGLRREVAARVSLPAYRAGMPMLQTFLGALTRPITGNPQDCSRRPWPGSSLVTLPSLRQLGSLTLWCLSRTCPRLVPSSARVILTSPAWSPSVFYSNVHFHSTDSICSSFLFSTIISTLSLFLTLFNYLHWISILPALSEKVQNIIMYLCIAFCVWWKCLLSLICDV